MPRSRDELLRAAHGGRDPRRVDVNACRQLRGELVERARGIVDTAGAAARDLTPAEARDVDEALDEADELHRVVRLEEAERAGERADADRNPAGREPGPGDPADGRTHDHRAEPPLILRTDDGRPVRAVTRGHSFADAIGAEPVGDEPNLLGRTLVSAFTGADLLSARERDLMSGFSDPSGGYFLSPALSAEVVDLMRNVSVLDLAGAVTVPLSAGETSFVTVTEDPQAAWRAEHAQVADTTMKLGRLVMRPRSLAAMVTLSDELASDAPNAAETVERVLAQAVAVEVDGRLFRGGDEVPSQIGAGVLDTEGVGAVDLDGDPPDGYDPWLDAIELVEGRNIVPTVRLDSPRTKRQLAGLKVGEGDARQLPAPAEVAALRHIVSNQIPTSLGDSEDESASVVGNFGRAGAMVLVGVRSELRIEATRIGGGAFERLQVKVRIAGRFDIATARPGGLTVVRRIGPTPE